jgi:hypothetical protein
MNPFKHDTSGLAWIWAIAILTFVMMPVIYFPLSYVFDHLYVSITGTYTFTGDTAYGLAAIKLIVSFLLFIGVVIVINWSIVQSKAQSNGG